MDIREKIGQRLVFGFPGTTIPAEFAALVREYKIGNVILFRYNIESLPQLARLCADIQKLVRGKLRAVNAESDHKNTPLQSGGQEVNFSQYVRKTGGFAIMEHPLKTLWEKPSRLVIGFRSGTSAGGGRDRDRA